MSDIVSPSLQIYVQSFKIRWGEVNAYNELTFPALFNYLGEIAFNHADALSKQYESKAEFSFAVVWTRMKIQLHSLPRWKEKITIKTWISPIDPTSKYAFRNYKILSAEGQEIGYGYGSLLFFDLHTRKATSIPKDVQSYPTSSEVPGNHQFSHLSKTIEPNIPIFRQTAYFSHLDQYKHVNNVSYLKWLMNSLETSFLKNYALLSAELHFLQEIRIGDEICVASEIQNLETHPQVESHLQHSESNKNMSGIITHWQKRK